MPQSKGPFLSGRDWDVCELLCMRMALSVPSSIERAAKLRSWRLHFFPLSVRNRGAQKTIISEHTKYLCCCWGRSDPVRALQCPRSAAPDVKWCRESSPEGNVSGRRRRPGKKHVNMATEALNLHQNILSRFFFRRLRRRAPWIELIYF